MSAPACSAKRAPWLLQQREGGRGALGTVSCQQGEPWLLVKPGPVFAAGQYRVLSGCRNVTAQAGPVFLLASD